MKLADAWMDGGYNQGIKSQSNQLTSKEESYV